MNGEIHIKEADKNILVDQNTPQGHLAPLPQVDSEGGLHEPAQGSRLEDYTTAQSKKDQPPDHKPSWVEVTKKTTTNASTIRSAPSSSVTSPKPNAEMHISARTETTGNDFGKIFKRLADLEKKVAKGGYG